MEKAHIKECKSATQKSRGMRSQMMKDDEKQLPKFVLIKILFVREIKLSLTAEEERTSIVHVFSSVHARSAIL
jgi:hypothetical protein